MQVENTSSLSCVFTVFTPTYNRVSMLHRVYDSLCAQTFRDFEWLIIDDGSRDGTAELVKKWQAVASFPIRYLWQENQGKHIAFNRAVKEAYGELFLPLDSDDACVPTALERFHAHWKDIPEPDRPKFTAVTALCADTEGNVIGSKFPRDVFDSDSQEITYKYKVSGEKWGFHRTDVLRDFPFPPVKGVKFIPEGVVWSAIARHYQTRFINEPLRVYYYGKHGDAGQLTATDCPGRHAVGLVYWYRAVLNNELSWFWYAPGRFLHMAINYCRFSLHAGISISSQIKELRISLARLLYILCAPIGWAAYLRDKAKKFVS
jgi:glycosyltransferase involved in cell wall biosynthesis